LFCRNTDTDKNLSNADEDTDCNMDTDGNLSNANKLIEEIEKIEKIQIATIPQGNKNR